MATGKQVIARLAPLLGLRPTTLERQLRAQRLARQLPTGLPGGGGGSAHFNAQHLTTVLLGLAGHDPSDAPAAAVELRPMPFRGTRRPTVAEPLPTFEDQIADWISKIAEAHRLARAEYAAVAADFQSWQLSLCLKPRRGIIEVGYGDNHNVITYATDPEPPFATRTRCTVLHGELMLVLGELLADTIEQTNATAVQFLASTQPAKAGAEQEQENAGNLRQEAPASFRDQPRANGTDRSSTTSDGIQTQRELQAGPVTPTETQGDDDRCPTMILMT